MASAFHAAPSLLLRSLLGHPPFPHASPPPAPGRNASAPADNTSPVPNAAVSSAGGVAGGGAVLVCQAVRASVQVGAFARPQVGAFARPQVGAFARPQAGPPAESHAGQSFAGSSRPNCPCCGDGILAEVDRLLIQ